MGIMSATNNTDSSLRRLFGLERDLTFNRLQMAYEEYTLNALTLRLDQMRRRGQTDRRRDYNREFGYTENPTVELYQQLYDREPYARRAVEIWPDEACQVTPSVYEVEDADTVTDFEQGVNDLPRQLRGRSWYAGTEGNPIFAALRMAAILAGIGCYGGLLLGLDDIIPGSGRTLADPVVGVEENNTRPAGKGSPAGSVLGGYSFSTNAQQTANRRLLYLRPLSQSQCQISRWETNPTSPRYLHPVEYQVTVGDPQGNYGDISVMPTSSQLVHWTRIVHICDEDVLHTPRLQPVLNPISDIIKVRGGSAEMYWLGAFAGHTLKVPPGIQPPPPEEAKAAYEQWREGLQRILIAGEGSELVGHAASVVDPTPQIMAQLQAMACILRFPLRVLLGTEEGKLAGGQDARALNRRVRGYQGNHFTPRFMISFYDRCIMLGVLPEPTEGTGMLTVDSPDGPQTRETNAGYSIWWPDLESSSDTEKAGNAQRLSSALAQFISSGASKYITLADFLSRFLGWDEEEAAAAAENGQAEQALQQEQDMARREQEIARGLAADPTQPKVVAGGNGQMPPVRQTGAV
jgi:hypothetical protein